MRFVNEGFSLSILFLQTPLPLHEGQIFSQRFIVLRRPSRNLGVPRQHIAYSLRLPSSDGRVCREGAASVHKLWENRGISAQLFGAELGMGRTRSIDLRVFFFWFFRVPAEAQVEPSEFYQANHRYAAPAAMQQKKTETSRSR